MKNILNFFTTLVIFMATFSTIKACEIYVQFNPAWVCGELEVCWGVPNGNGDGPENGQNCITIIENEIIDLPNGVDFTFSTDDCAPNTYFNIFNTNNELLITVDIVGPSIEWTWTTDCGALPIELVSFNGRVINTTVKLNWRLASQENLKEIVIYRNSVYVESIDNTDREQMIWSYTDGTPTTGVNYYKLEFIDYDGKSTFSDLITVQFTVKKVTHITKRVSNTHVFKADGDRFKYTVCVFTLDGQLMLERYWSGEGQDEMEILFGNPGIYLVAMNNGTTMQTFKVVVN